MLPTEHLLRRVAADEVHARPQDALATPALASFVAAMFGPDDRPRELEHLAALCERYGASPPAAVDAHFAATLGHVRLRWERHGEFSTYMWSVPGSAHASFTTTAIDALPAGWLAAIPGSTVAAAHAVVVPLPSGPPDVAQLAALLDGNAPVGAAVGDGAAWAFTDFRIRDDGFVRFVVYDRALTPRQAGRTLQRLFDIETYRVMALLGFPVARELSPRTSEIERALSTLTGAIADEPGQDEALLSELTRLAAQVETARNQSEWRFGASRAYHEVVRTRIGELREQRLPGIQTIGEFMGRRLAPAMATCASVGQRLRELSDRVAHASSLLATRVEIARERQNQSLLASMDRRARLQLRLQRTVEWLSVAAVTYYAVGLAGYAAKALAAAGVPVDDRVVQGIALPLVAVVAVWILHRARHRFAREGGADDP
jgi:uncharacterized membrane-anchored protein